MNGMSREELKRRTYENERGCDNAVLLFLLRMLHGATIEYADDEQNDAEYDGFSVERPSTTNANQGQRRNVCF